MIRLIFIAASLAGGLVAEGRLSPIAKLTLSTQWPPGVVASTLAFISEDAIAIAQYPGSAGTLSGSLVLIDWRTNRLRLSKEQSIALDRAGWLFPSLYGTSSGNILASVPKPKLWSRDLKVLSEVPVSVLVPSALRSNSAAERINKNEWRLYRLGPPPVFVRSGRGEILSVTDDFIAVRGDRDLRIEKADGSIAASFPMEPRSACAERVAILGPDRLMFTDCNNDRVLDFSGKQLVSLPKRDGWGFRHGLSADGSRALFDDFTRRISREQRISEFFQSVMSLGMGPSIDSRGEELRVVDTRSGAVCFDLDTPERQFGHAGDYHADVSPSGRYVAVIDGLDVSVYALPNVCK